MTALTDAECNQLARETAEHIAARQDGHVPAAIGGPPPGDVATIKETLLSGHIWISWLDSTVTAAMRQLHADWGDPPCPNCGQEASARFHATADARALRDCPTWVADSGWRYDFGTTNYEPCIDCGTRIYLTDASVAIDGAIVCGPCGKARYGDQVAEYQVV